MTKTNEKIHVLADESLGGIKREYVEVDRKAKVGDLIVITASNYEEREEIYVAGHYGKVIAESEFSVNEFEADFNGFDNSFVGDDGLWYVGGSDHGEYRVIEPTNIVHIDGDRYEMVDRNPEKGEKVIVLDRDVRKVSPGSIYEVPSPVSSRNWVNAINEEGRNVVLMNLDYRVLVESSEEEPQPSDPIDVIANLATRVAELERENKRIKEDLGWNEMGPGRIAELRNADSDIRHDIAALEERVDNDYEEVDAWADSVNEKMSRLQDEIDTLHKDNRRHGEELEALKYAAKETDGKMAHLEADSDMRLFTAEEVAALLNAMRERR
ncbi:hypothetical protein MOC17_16315 [Bacillus haynesii]|uniref:hypothetical protein n=1 Tax=Bacillus haynesii TaxID=1925021 RepID=UPI0022812CF5|nr:hypothetical protein [Bacillus haynesii]MCY8047633.1 hypothetical protein [Bacillus haynesii]